VLLTGYLGGPEGERTAAMLQFHIRESALLTGRFHRDKPRDGVTQITTIQGRNRMADEEGTPEQKTLEARVAELEDKLSQVHITEDEMKAFRKVSRLLGQTGAASGAATAAGAGAIDECGVNECGVIRQPIINQCVIRQPIFNCIIRQPIIRACTFECFECGPCGAPGGGVGGVGGGGFGGLGG
jgi:hypothetical protein